MISLAGSFLVANKGLTDSNFSRSVVLMLAHDEGGAYGVVVNKSVSVEGVPFPVYVGGPVESQGVILVHGHSQWSAGETEGELRPGHSEVAAGIYIGDAACFKRATESNAKDLLRVRVFRNYSGWGPGQLESELAEDTWTIVAASPIVLFDTPIDEIWLRLKRNVIPQPSVN
ncbi:MAG TPA: YqgE/AlgH family protein [Gemmataceae bacterium]|jgi:putative transcriptional regulator|nr:YqgE/AlgH family protein [Gemmataceae bacterium]